MTVRTTPVALFLIEIVTPGITAPVASVTVPESVAPVTWACATTLGKRVKAKTKQTARRERNSSGKPLIVTSAVRGWDGPPRCHHDCHDRQTNRRPVFKYEILAGVYL